MNTFKKFLAVSALVLALAVSGLAQTATTTTYLASAVSSSATTRFVVASATGFAVGNAAFVNGEAVRITAVNGTNIDVMRGSFQTRAAAHPIYSTVWVGPVGTRSPFRFDDPNEGSAVTASSVPYLPQINVRNGQFWSVAGSRWVKGNNFAVTTNYGLSPAIWADCPLDKMAYDSSYGTTVGDEFIEHANTTAHRYELTGANGTFTAVTGVAHGVAILTAPGTDNDEAYLASHNDASGIIKADAASNWWFEARVKMNQIATSQGVFVGLGEETGIAVDFMTDNTMALKVVDTIGFQVIAATDIAAVWQAVMQLNGGARVAVDSDVGTSSTSYVKLGMKSIAGTVYFFVDGVLQASVASSATNFPLDQVMEAVFATKCGSAAANTLTIDWWRAAQSRLAN